MRNNEKVEFIRLYNRSVDLINSLPPRGTHRRDRDAANRYNTLRADVKKLVNDPDFDRSIPPAWCLRPLPHIPIGVSILLLVAACLYLLIGTQAVLIYLIVISLFVIVNITWGNRIGHGFGWTLHGDYWFLASTIEQVRNRTDMLHSYLRDYITLNYPNILPKSRSEDEEERKHRQLSTLQRRNLELYEELGEAELEINRLKARLAGLETPMQYEVPQDVLVKLDRLERTRLQEAVQAYRVNAWTPCAAVCGMILEGRLQRLCRENGIPQSGIKEMIGSLGKAGILKGYHRDLAQVGEFFRHRAAHPTTEEFDREKTTLVLTSLVLLLRGLF